MSLVFAAVCSHAPGITGRAHLADPALKDALHAELHRLGESLREAGPDALVIVAAEHFANFFMDNMPAYAIGMANHYEGPIEDPGWLGIARTRIPGNADLRPADAAARAAEIFVPYHAAIRRHLDARLAARRPTILVSVHSFTPVFLDVARPWHCGVLFNRDARLAEPLLRLLRADEVIE